MNNNEKKMNAGLTIIIAIIVFIIVIITVLFALIDGFLCDHGWARTIVKATNAIHITNYEADCKSDAITEKEIETLVADIITARANANKKVEYANRGQTFGELSLNGGSSTSDQNYTNACGPYQGKYEEYFNKYGEKYGIDPQVLAAIAMQESSLEHYANPPANTEVKKNKGSGATGLMQLMPATARGLGVDPLNLDGNVEGAAKYIREMLDYRNGDLELALASYNYGPGNVNKQLKNGKTTWDSIKNNVPKETQNYVPSVINYYIQFTNETNTCDADPAGPSPTTAPSVTPVNNVTSTSTPAPTTSGDEVIGTKGDQIAAGAIEMLKNYGKDYNKTNPILYEMGAGHGSNQNIIDLQRGDCSAFSAFVYAKYADLNIAGTAASQSQMGTVIKDINQMAPGDLVVFGATSGYSGHSTPNLGNISHVGIYIGDGYFVHLHGPSVSTKGEKNAGYIDKDSLITNPYYKNLFVAGVRVTEAGSAQQDLKDLGVFTAEEEANLYVRSMITTDGLALKGLLTEEQVAKGELDYWKGSFAGTQVAKMWALTNTKDYKKKWDEDWTYIDKIMNVRYDVYYCYLVGGEDEKACERLSDAVNEVNKTAATKLTPVIPTEWIGVLHHTQTTVQDQYVCVAKPEPTATPKPSSTTVPGVIISSNQKAQFVLTGKKAPDTQIIIPPNKPVCDPNTQKSEPVLNPPPVTTTVIKYKNLVEEVMYGFEPYSLLEIGKTELNEDNNFKSMFAYYLNLSFSQYSGKKVVATSDDTNFQLPLSNTLWAMARGFGEYEMTGTDGKKQTYFNNGIDISTPAGDVLSVYDGKVSYISDTQVYVQHDNGYYSMYENLKAGTIKVKNNQQIKTGQVLAQVSDIQPIILKLSICKTFVQNTCNNYIDPTELINFKK